MCQPEKHAKYKGLTEDSKAGPVWTGETRLWEPALIAPLRWKKPRKIFVNSEGDLFHESVPDAWIDRVFAVMALCPQHTFQVLTKRAERMRAYVTSLCESEGHLEHICDAAIALLPCAAHVEDMTTPLPNVWLGVSCERHQEADERIPHLLAAPAAIRFISAEPLLGPIDLCAVRWGFANALTGLDCVIAGGESGRDARPMHPDWVRSLRDQCAAAGVPFFFKQWGEHGTSDLRGFGTDGSQDAAMTRFRDTFDLDELPQSNAKRPRR